MKWEESRLRFPLIHASSSSSSSCKFSHRQPHHPSSTSSPSLLPPSPALPSALFSISIDARSVHLLPRRSLPFLAALRQNGTLS